MTERAEHRGTASGAALLSSAKKLGNSEGRGCGLDFFSLRVSGVEIFGFVAACIHDNAESTSPTIQPKMTG